MYICSIYIRHYYYSIKSGLIFSAFFSRVPFLQKNGRGKSFNVSFFFPFNSQHDGVLQFFTFVIFFKELFLFNVSFYRLIDAVYRETVRAEDIL